MQDLPSAGFSEARVCDTFNHAPSQLHGILASVKIKKCKVEMRFIRKTNYYQDIKIFKHEGQIFWYGFLALTLFLIPFFASEFYLGELTLVFIYAIAVSG